MKKILLTLLAFLSVATANAEPVSRQQALKKAGQFMPGKKFSESKASTRSDESDAFYVFNAEGNGGYVIVSGDDRTTEILGYSKTGNLDMNQLPENLKWWLDGYTRQIKALGNSVKPAQKSKTRVADSWEAIAPLIKTKWNQHEPFNLMCPDKNGNVFGDDGFDVNYICVTGCVAAAMAQIMYYYNYPQNCPAIDEYTTGKGWKMNALPATTFKWAQMKKTYKGDETDESAGAVAELFRYCGQAVSMDYGLGGSEAGVSPYDMAEVFGYSKNAKLLSRSMYSSSDWENMVYKDLSENHPVLYGGASMSGGHQFIVDGYDGSGLYHMNWGWGGMSDGYYVLSLANPDELGAGGGTSKDGYSMDQHAIFGLKPGTPEEVEIPKFYGDFSGKLASSEFSRASASEDFTGIVLPGLVFFQYENTDQTDDCTFEAGWGLYKDGTLLNVLGVSGPVTLDYIYNAVSNNSAFSFGKDLADGQYQFRQMYKLEGSTEWQLCKAPYDGGGNLMNVFIEAIISGDNLTLRKSELDEYTSDITVNSVNFYPAALEVGKPVEVTVNLTNNGDSYQELVYLTLGSQKTVVCGSVEAGKTGHVKLHLTPDQAGTMTLKVSTDYNAKNVVRSESVTVEAAKQQSLSGTMVIDNFDKDNRVLTGSTLKVTAQFSNSGANIYENAIQLILCRNTEEPGSGYISGPIVASKSVMTTIPVGETKNVDFVIEDLDLNDQYFFNIRYSSGGIWIKCLSSYLFTLTDALPTPDPDPTPDPGPTSVPGDADGNGKVETADIDAVVRYIMEGDFEGFNFDNANLNDDDKVDAADLVLLIKMLQP